MRLTRAATILPAMLAVAVGTATAQQADPRLSEERQPVGWSVTPRVSSSTAWDDNVLIQGKGDALSSDLNTAINPGGSLDFVGKRGSFAASYSGSVQLYRDFSTLNSYDQSMNVSGRRQMTPHLLLFGQQSYSKTPTTELPALAGIPFLRIGARIADLRGGIEATPSKRLSIAASYNFQWIAFDKDPLLGVSLLGGHSNGGSAGAKYQISTRTMLTADYDLQRASIITGGRFTVQNSWAGADYRLTDASHIYGALGIARLDAADLGTGKTSPAWRLGYARRFESAAIDVLYARSFVPSYGSGGTLSNEELTSSLHVPFGRRTYAEGTLSWRTNEPLVAGDLPLTSIWAGGVLGYAVHPWLRVEGFYGGTHQTIDRPGGRLDRRRIGVQVVTAKPVRIN
ncbi:MAG TPA: hypothetical protein VM032_04470 [Vicinamibacterales bacterium]|nr:hypothetical protein [Vicinamibacterales bacterium]